MHAARPSRDRPGRLLIVALLLAIAAIALSVPTFADRARDTRGDSASGTDLWAGLLPLIAIAVAVAASAILVGRAIAGFGRARRG